MSTIKLTLFLIGTTAFFVTVYISVKHPSLILNPSDDLYENNALVYVEKGATWMMWIGWGCAAVLTLFDNVGFFEFIDGL